MEGDLYGFLLSLPDMKSWISQKDKWPLLIASGLLLIGAILFSTKGIIVKLLYRYSDIDALSMLALRMLFATPMYIVIYFFRKKKKAEEYQLKRRDWLTVILIGILGYHAASWMNLIGLQYISASMERLVFFCFPTLVVLILFIFFHEPITKKISIALVLTYLGIAIAFTDRVGMDNHNNFPVGLFFTGMTAFIYAIYFVLSGRLLPKIGTLRYTCIGMCGAGTSVFLHHVLSGGGSLFDFEKEVYAYILLMALISTVLPSFMILEGIRIIGASRSSILLSIGPIATLVMAKYILGENFGLPQLLGTLFVIAGITYLSVTRSQKTKTQ